MTSVIVAAGTAPLVQITGPQSPKSTRLNFEMGIV
jgi:hypothetical protein